MREKEVYRLRDCIVTLDLGEERRKLILNDGDGIQAGKRGRIKRYGAGLYVQPGY